MKFYSVRNLIGLQVNEATGATVLLLRDGDAVIKIDLQNKKFEKMTQQERDTPIKGDIKNF